MGTATYRDAAQERVFEALPPLRGRAFARGRWARAWLAALEESALDGQQVKAGRGYARAGAVGAVAVRPGRLTGLVHDKDGTAYRADVLVRPLPDGDWERLTDLVARRTEHLAALLDRDLPPHLAEDAAAAGVDLMPGVGDLDPRCACEAWDHCAHTAALCHQVARLLDEDPFVLLLVRGRTEEALLGELRACGTAGAPERTPEVAPRGVPAREAFAPGRALPPLPAPPPPVEAAELVPVFTAQVAPPPGLDVAALEFLAADAAGRARRLLAAALSPGHGRTPLPRPLTERQDAERLASSAPPGLMADRLASAYEAPSGD
ncbi:hypothetical protein GCM10010218_08560 [Streptomyces mashuensis]|uniref:SWF or SNF family helicase n=1 Tax=Streptomyces mashuensis TaxID=33904 RepID=A0A919AYL2_9ACTN|nr:SWF or SNF family helicase [Streptomyces mashuensis]GHF29683.1 hypothetical protein GCM10010218_08560 [Streptomyces mashuensis]